MEKFVAYILLGFLTVWVCVQYFVQQSFTVTEHKYM